MKKKKKPRPIGRGFFMRGGLELAKSRSGDRVSFVLFKNLEKERCAMILIFGLLLVGAAVGLYLQRS